MEDIKRSLEPVTRARVIQLLDQFFGTKCQPGEDVGIFISRVKTAATRLQEVGHKLDDLYIGFQLIRWLPQEFQSTVQQIYRWKEEDFRVVKIEAELILEANRLQLMKQDLEKAENAYLSSFTSKKSKMLPGATAAAHGDPKGKNDYQKKGGIFRFAEQQEALMVEVTIPNCYKQAIRSRDASKWHDAMDKEINVMMERKIWHLVDHPDNIKILENRWVYTIKYDENNKIVRYKAHLVARDDIIIFGKEMENVNFVLQLLQKNFDLKIMGKTKKLLGIEFEEIGFCEGDTRNRWRDGQVCPDVDKELWRLGPDGSGVFWRWTSVSRCGQGTMAPWARRLGCVLACYAPIGRGRRQGEKEQKKEDKIVRERERTEGGGETERESGRE
ncbi:hypothetical protein TNCV_1072911 [Trichonephila clavipes]|nr:hypothetical protein TNCV_1072911 [Trichonephila clavipes]